MVQSPASVVPVDIARSSDERSEQERVLIGVRDRASWNDIVHAMPTSFLTQTWEWGELYEGRGWEAHRLALLPRSAAAGIPDGAVQVLVRRLPLVGWGIGYAPRGPLTGPGADVRSILSSLTETWAPAHGIATVVVDPAVGADSPLGRSVTAAPWTAAPHLGQDRVHVLDLNFGSTAWDRLRPKHRQWIRRAERAGVEVRWADSTATDNEAEAGFRHFAKVYEEVAARLGLSYDRALLHAVWTTFRRAGSAHIVTATDRDVPLAALLVIVSGDEMVGYAGGQTSAGASVGAGKLVQWRAIQRAQELGLRRYNMWGTTTGSLAHYKEGFGAREERYVGTRALAIDRMHHRVVQAAWFAQRAVRQLRRLAPTAASVSARPVSGSVQAAAAPEA